MAERNATKMRTCSKCNEPKLTTAKELKVHAKLCLGPEQK